MSIKHILVSGIVAALATASVSAMNIAQNGGFETGTGADSDFWTEFGGGPAGTSSERSTAGAISGNWSHVLNAVGDATAGASAGINYNSISDGGFASLQEGTSVTLSFDANFDPGPGGVGFYALRILNSNGAIVADSGLQNLLSGSNSYNNILSLNVPAFAASPNDVYAAFVEFSVGAGAFDGSSSTAIIDNVVIDATLVPAPGAAGLLALGGLAAARRRR